MMLCFTNKIKYTFHIFHNNDSFRLVCKYTKIHAMCENGSSFNPQGIIKCQISRLDIGSFQLLKSNLNVRIKFRMIFFQEHVSHTSFCFTSILIHITFQIINVYVKVFDHFLYLI